jgi:hypothetical protein
VVVLVESGETTLAAVEAVTKGWAAGLPAGEEELAVEGLGAVGADSSTSDLRKSEK